MHSLLQDESDVPYCGLAPQQIITTKYLDDFIDYCLNNGYEFVNPIDINILRPINGKKILLTFDDGYRNNLSVLPLLEKYNISAMLFISPFYVVNQISFFWDIIWREFNTRKFNLNQYSNYRKIFDRLPFDLKINKLVKDFGYANIYKNNELSRPLNIYELNEIDKSKLVYFGNHTYNHSLLIHLNKREIHNEIIMCNNYLSQYKNYLSNWLAYPSGYFNKKVVEEVKKIKIEYGLTTIQRRNSFPLKYVNNFINLNRYTLRGNGIINEIINMNTFFNIKSQLQIIKRYFQ